MYLKSRRAEDEVAGPPSNVRGSDILKNSSFCGRCGERMGNWQALSVEDVELDADWRDVDAMQQTIGLTLHCGSTLRDTVSALGRQALDSTKDELLRLRVFRKPIRGEHGQYRYKHV